MPSGIPGTRQKRIKRICPVCDGIIEHYTNKTCSRKCANTLVSRARKKGTGPRENKEPVTADQVNKFLQAGYTVEMLERLFGADKVKAVM